MFTKNKTSIVGGLISILVLLLLSACGNNGTTTPLQDTSTSTPTPTVVVVEQPPTPTPPISPCAGLAGELEIQVLVGPSEAVGLAPDAVGGIQFAVTSDEAPYLVQGSGGIDYADTLTKEWGTYEVTMNMTGNITGECIATDEGATLDIILEMTGSQVVVVTAEGFSQTYPWEGTNTFNLAFPLEDGASVEGEGYSFVLHLQ